MFCMSERSLRLVLEDLLDSIKKIETYTRGISFDDFYNDPIVVDAVVRNFQVLGEAAKRIPSEIRKMNQDINWRKIIGLRNRIVHDYFGIDYKIVWKIIEKDIPLLKIQLERVYHSLEK